MLIHQDPTSDPAHESDRWHLSTSKFACSSSIPDIQGSVYANSSLPKAHRRAPWRLPSSWFGTEPIVLCWLPVTFQHSVPQHEAVPLGPVTLVGGTAASYVLPFVTLSAITSRRIGHTSPSTCSLLRASRLRPYAEKAAATPTSRLSAVRISGSQHRSRDGSYRKMHLHRCPPAPCEVHPSCQVTLVKVHPVSWPYWLLDG
jgi:hypothetical protein